MPRATSKSCTMNKVLITAGEPAGIGPDIVVQLAEQQALRDSVVLGDIDVIQARATMHGVNLTCQAVSLDALPAHPQDDKVLWVHPVPLGSPVTIGHPQVAHAHAVIECLERAVTYCREHHDTALMTLPIQKATLNEAGFAFHGHTDFLADRCGCQTTMCFDTPALKLALVTDHCPLKAVPDEVTVERLHATIGALHSYCQAQGIAKPRLAVCGLNPHAGEQGHLGDEELAFIDACCDTWRKEGLDIMGPIPACTAMTPLMLERVDGIVSMYHDQLLPALKALYFDEAVNVTLGLPFRRSSPDHGTALDRAGKADLIHCQSTLRAIELLKR